MLNRETPARFLARCKATALSNAAQHETRAGWHVDALESYWPSSWQRVARAEIKRNFVTGSPTGARFGSDNAQWIETPERFGFRFVGFADDLARRFGYYRAIEHQGYFTSDDCDSVMRGAVYQLPGRDGCARFVPAYLTGGSGKRGWQSDNDGAVMFLGDIETAPGSDWETAAWQAAKYADSRAETHAEREREYQEAWRAGSNWQSLGDDLATVRRDALALAREIKQSAGAVCAIGPSVTAAVRAQFRALVRRWAEIKRGRAKIWGQWEGMKPVRRVYPEGFGASTGRAYETGSARLWQAFCDGAGI